MQYILFILGLLVGAIGMLWMVLASTSIHEVQAAVVLLIAAVFVCASAIVDAIQRLRKDLKTQRDTSAP